MLVRAILDFSVTVSVGLHRSKLQIIVFEFKVGYNKLKPIMSSLGIT